MWEREVGHETGRRRQGWQEGLRRQLLSVTHCEATGTSLQTFLPIATEWVFF